MRRGTAVHCRICSQLRPNIRANAVGAFGDRAFLDRTAPCSADHAWIGSAQPMEPVSMRSVLCVPVISAGMFSAALAIAGRPAVAADCLVEPNRDTPPGPALVLSSRSRQRSQMLVSPRDGAGGCRGRRRRWSCNRSDGGRPCRLPNRNGGRPLLRPSRNGDKLHRRPRHRCSGKSRRRSARRSGAKPTRPRSISNSCAGRNSIATSRSPPRGVYS